MRVDILPPAWLQLGALPVKVAQAINDRLDALAKAAQTAEPGVQELTSSTLIVGGYVAFYELDPRSQTLTLLEVQPRREGPLPTPGRGQAR